MARLNFSSPNEFDPRTYGGPRPDDMLKMLQLAMQEQRLRRQSDAYTPQPSASPADGTGTPPGGLLGRWLELQAAQQQPVSPEEDREQMPSAPTEPRFRLVRVSPASPSPVGIGTSNRPSYFALGDDNPPDVMPTSDQGSGDSVRDTDRTAPVIAGFAQQIGRGLGRPIGPAPAPPMQIPAWWKKAQELLSMYAQSRYGRDGQTPDIAASASGATIFNQKKPPGGRKIEDDEDESFDHEKFMAEFKRQIAENARKRGQFRRTPSYDPKDYCSDQHTEEIKNCNKRMHEYAHWDFYGACIDRAGERRDRCDKGDPDPSDKPEWSLKEEEMYNNLWR